MKAPQELTTFTRERLVGGRPVQIECFPIAGQTFSTDRELVTVVRLEDEWYEDVMDPEAVIRALRDSEFKPDIFTFWQRLPDVEPKYSYHMEWESIAALPITSYDHWFDKQISSRTRNQIRKGKKEGLDVRESRYDDAFVRGATEIFNETPIRQGRRFWHYGKDFETIKKQFSKFLFREQLISAYYRDEMVGFVMLGNAGNYAITGQIISKISHRDKSTNNILIAKAVEVCAREQLPYLVYLFWTDDSLSEFKRRCGFEETKVPRYFVPLTRKGKLALKFGLHRGWKKAVPKQISDPLKKLRRRWYDLRSPA